jgi:uncharacterized tellurite resistance protein B-like protein
MNFKEILNLFRQGKATAKSHIKNLIEIAAADGNFGLDEQQLLRSIAKRNNISDSQLKEIHSDPSRVAFEAPKDDIEKFHQLYDLVHMMSIDKTIHSEEVRLCELFAIKFGYNKERVKELIETVRLNIENGNGHEEAMKRVSSYIKL